MIAEQLPSMTCNAGEPQDPQPESQPMVDEPIRIGPGLMWDSETREMWAAMNAEASWKLTEDTTPEAIEATQRAVVEEAMRERPGATAAEISEAVVLPVWNVKRLMEAA